MAKETQLVVFELNLEDTKCEYAIPISQVQEITRPTTVTKLPQTDDCVEGIINLRGSIIGVIDLKKKLGLGRSVYDDDTRIIVLEIYNQKVAIIVDSVSEVLRMAVEEIDQVATVLSSINKRYLTGVCRMDDRLILALDPAQLLAL